MFQFSYSSFMASMVVSGIGFVMFRYGRKQGSAMPVVIGIALMAFPYFVTDLWPMLGIAAGLCGLAYLLR